MTKIYLGCALTRAPQSHKDFVEHLRICLKEAWFTLLAFHGLVSGTPQGVYKHDLEQVETCDIFVAECSEPSLGLGVELAHANALKKPTLLLARKDVPISRMITGMPNPNMHTLFYTTEFDIVEAVKALEKNLYQY